MVLKPETEENPGEEYGRIVPAADWPRTILAARADIAILRECPRFPRMVLNQTL